VTQFIVYPDNSVTRVENGRGVSVLDAPAVLKRYGIPEERPFLPDEVAIYNKGGVEIKAFSTISTLDDYHAHLRDGIAPKILAFIKEERSTEYMAAKCGVRQGAVLNTIQALREGGYQIRYCRTKGWVLD